MLLKPNLYLGAASIVMGAGGAVNFQNSCVVARTGVGTYTFTFDQQICSATSNSVPLFGAIVAAGVACAINVVGPVNAGSPNQSTYTVTTSATSGGGAADIVGSLCLVAIRI